MPSRSRLWLCHVLGVTLNLEPVSLAFPTIWKGPSFFSIEVLSVYNSEGGPFSTAEH